MTVQGQVSVQGAPDTLTLSLGIQTQSATAAIALDSNSTKADALVNTMEADGIAKADLQTSGLSVQPVYNNTGATITGYQVTNTVTITVHDLARAGTIIDDAAKVAGNAIRVNSVAFSIEDSTALVGRARAGAVRQATGQAAVLASAAGMALGPLCSLRDNTQLPQPQPQPVWSGFAAAAPAVHLPPIEAGTEQVTADVTAIYQLDTPPAATKLATSTSTTS